MGVSFLMVFDLWLFHGMISGIFQMKRYFSMRKRYPQNFTKALPSLAEPIFKAKQQTVLAHRYWISRSFSKHGENSFNSDPGTNMEGGSFCFAPVQTGILAK